MKRATKIWIAAGAVVIAGGIAAAVVSSKDRKLPQVEISKVEKSDLISKVAANGKIEAKRKVDLSANVMGQIVNLAVREGDLVKKGDFLLQIDRAQLAADAAGAEASVQALVHDLAAARAAASEAELVYARAQKSFRDKLIPQAELDRARSSLESARSSANAVERRIAQGRAGLAGARDTLSKTTIRAPISGLITFLPVEEGEVAVIGTMNNPGTVLLTISDMSEVEAVMDVDETDVPNVKVGQKASVTVDAYASRPLEGIVTEVASSPREMPGTSDAVNFEVRIQLTNPPADVRPGFSASGEITTGSKAQVLAIPIQALIVRDKPGKDAEKSATEEEGVFVYDGKEQKVRFAPVTTGITGETSIEIGGGLKTGDEIVIGPFKVLREIEDGSKVRVQEKGKGEKEKQEKSG